MNRGYIIIFNTIIFMAIIVIILIGVVSPIISNYSAAQSSMFSTKAFLLADSATEDAIYRLKNSKNIAVSPATQNINLSQGTSTIIVTNTSTGKTITVNSVSGAYQKNTRVNVSLGTGISFHYGIQSGNGGFVMQNSSTVTGNVFSNGTVTGDGNFIYGDVISASSTGLISNINATGTVYAHTLQNSTVGRDAHYTSIDSFTNTHVSGTKYPSSTDQPLADLPITDAQINEWENDATIEGGTATCSGGAYTINSAQSLGPLRIPCNLNINGTAGGYTVTIEGPIWVEGNITVSQKALLVMSPSLGSNNVAIIADNKSASTTSSIISLSNKASFQGSGTAGSYVFMISQNSSAERGGSTNAIEIGQSSNALVGYAIHGLITLAQSVSLKEVTAYKIVLTQSSNVLYDTGLPNTLFESGPGGGYNLIDWTEI